MNILKNKTLILGSKSPRRKELLDLCNIPCQVRTIPVEENYPNHLTPIEVATFLSELKTSVFNPSENEIILTADTIVVLNGEVLGKPSSKEEAFQYLKKLSNNTHQVITGFTLRSNHKMVSKAVVSEVEIDDMTDEEINYYINSYEPYDKAGSYGIQEWIGYTMISNIRGSYANIMGLPTQTVYQELKNFV